MRLYTQSSKNIHYCISCYYNINNTPSKLTAAAPRMRTNPPRVRCYDTRRGVPPCAHAQSWPPLLGAGIAECAVPSRYKMKNRLNHAVS